MDYQAVIDELCRFAEAQKKLAAKSRQHPTVKRQAEVVAAVFIGLAAALEAGHKGRSDMDEYLTEARALVLALTKALEKKNPRTAADDKLLLRAANFLREMNKA